MQKTGLALQAKSVDPGWLMTAVWAGGTAGLAGGSLAGAKHLYTSMQSK